MTNIDISKLTPEELKFLEEEIKKKETVSSSDEDSQVDESVDWIAQEDPRIQEVRNLVKSSLAPGFYLLGGKHPMDVSQMRLEEVN